MERPDFTNCRRIPGRAYNGANGKKIAVEYNGDVYMLKFPPSADNKPTELSYTNSCISEYIASHIFNMLGIRCHETILGTFKISGKEKIVCACKDFTADGKELFDFCSIKNTVIDSEHGGTGTELADLLETIEKQEYVSPQVLTEHFWNVFVVDSLLGNFDRHNGNWGFLYDKNTEKAEIAPVYDCGSCLLPQADENTMKKVLENETELESRIYRFPTSALKLNNVKINYYEFLMNTDNVDCKDAVERIVPRIDIDEIKEFIDTVPYITDMQKEFYKKYVSARYEKIIAPAYDHIHDISQNEEPTMNM